MGFNLFVKMVVRAGALLIGFVGTTLLVGILNDLFPWFWLPVLLGIAVSAVCSTQSWFKATRLGSAFCVSLTAGTAYTFCLSTVAVTSRFGSIVPKLALGCGLGLFLLSVVVLVCRGFYSGKTKAMTAWLLIPIIAGCIVGYVSGGIGGANHMIGFCERVLHLSPEVAQILVRIVRKSIHVCAYGILGVSLFRGAFSGKASKRGALGFAMMMTFCLASFDEMRQTTAANRTGSPWDVLLDMTGSFVFVLIAAALVRSAPRKRSIS